MDRFKKGWFSEKDEGWDGLVQSYQVDEILAHEKSPYQDIVVFKARKTGITMAIDDLIQSTEMDEFAYHEMMAHVALYSHPNPKRVLIIGGGDCGVAREVLKHKCVEQVDQCDIDEKVTELTEKHMPHYHIADVRKDPRLHLYFEDGIAFIDRNPNFYDVIITDSCDPVGPAEKLFGLSYYQKVKKALRPGGISVSQGENIWLDADVICNLRDICRQVGFKYIEYSLINIPTYTAGSIGAFIISNDYSSKEPRREMTSEEASTMRYYNRAIHSASFAAPEFFRKRFEDQ